jgi:hypothetical protein
MPRVRSPNDSREVIMASITVCDICKKEVKDNGGTIASDPMGFGIERDGRRYELCLEHYRGMKDVMHEYVKYSQGFVASWPGQTLPDTTRAGQY